MNLLRPDYQAADLFARRARDLVARLLVVFLVDLRADLRDFLAIINSLLACRPCINTFIFPTIFNVQNNYLICKFFYRH